MHESGTIGGLRDGRRTPGRPLLEVADLVAGYGDIQVLWEVSLAVQPGELVALVGPNGAGKTTLLKTLNLLLPARGDVWLEGEPLLGRKAHQATALGIGHVPEGRQLFSGMTVRENLLMGAYSRPDRASPAVAADLESILDLFPDLRRRQKQQAGTLSGGEQQMVAIGRALMGRPRLLLVDELSLGLAPVLVDRLVGALQEINRSRGVSVLLVEQDVRLALEIAHYGYVLTTGRIVKHGPAADLLADAELHRAFLGM